MKALSPNHCGFLDPGSVCHDILALPAWSGHRRSTVDDGLKEQMVPLVAVWIPRCRTYRCAGGVSHGNRLVMGPTCFHVGTTEWHPRCSKLGAVLDALGGGDILDCCLVRHHKTPVATRHVDVADGSEELSFGDLILMLKFQWPQG